MRATEETGVREITEGRKLCVHFLWVLNSTSLCNLPEQIFLADDCTLVLYLTLRLLMSYIYGAPSKARNANVVYIWTYVWQR